MVVSLINAMNYCQRLNIIILLISIVFIKKCQSDCVMQGECYRFDDDNVVPCALGENDNRKPLLLKKSEDEEMFKSMKEFCPSILPNDNEAEVCCSRDQFYGLVTKLRNAHALLGPCPSCFFNFANLWCQFTCSPAQSSFMKVMKVMTQITDNENAVSRVAYNITDRFAKGLFNSCKNVHFGTTKALSLMSFRTETKITLKSWMAFMGSFNLKNKIPMKIDIDYDENVGMDVKTVACYEPINENEAVCSRYDCQDVYRGAPNIKNLSGKGTTEVISLNKVLKTSLTPSNAIRFVIIVVFIGALEYFFREGFIELRCRCLEYFVLLLIRYPIKCVFIGLLFAATFLSGNVKFQKIENTTEQSSLIDSITQIEKTKFITYFPESVHRIEQIALISRAVAPFSNKMLLTELFDFIDEIKESKFDGISFDEVCYRPLGNDSKCAIISMANYFQNSKHSFLNIKLLSLDGSDMLPDEYDSYVLHLEACVTNPFQLTTQLDLPCLADFGGPMRPEVIFGYTTQKSHTWGMNYASSQATFVTIPILNTPNAKIWENGLIEMLKNKTMESADISFMAESSIDKEIMNEAAADKWVSLGACLTVFIYLTFTLSKYHMPDSSILSAFVHTKLGVVMVCVFLNVLSSWCAIGFYSFFGIHATDNAIVVLFFINFCIGMNRCCMTSRNFQENGGCYGYSTMSRIMMKGHLIKVYRKTIPTAVSSSIICSLCFFISGGFPVIGEKMPIIETFARYASLAIFIDTVFFLLIFLPFFQYDAIREVEGRSEIWPTYTIDSAAMDALFEQQTSGVGRVGLTQMFSKIVPFFLTFRVRMCTLLVFFVSFVAALYMSSLTSYGFDQTTAFTKDSYLTKHLRNLNKHLNVGPPVYFVVEGDLDWNERSIQNKFCSLAGCDESSIGNTLNFLTSKKMANNSILSGDVYNWVDSFLQFLDPYGTCCQMKGNDTYCLPKTNGCLPCVGLNTVSGRDGGLSNNLFYKHLEHFMSVKPGLDCPNGGYATGRPAIYRENGIIKAVHFMTFFKRLNLSDSGQCHKVMKDAQVLAKDFEDIIGIPGVRVFPYSLFFIHYEQYSSICETLIYLAIFVFIVVLGATIWLVGYIGAILTVITLISSFLYMIALMYWLGIEINQISATNMTMFLGMTIEFVIQVLYGFYNSKKSTAVERGLETVLTNGATIIFGIMPSILLTACSLCFAASPILRIYFGYLFFGITIVSGLHAVVFLPTLLVTFGEYENERERFELVQKSDVEEGIEMSNMATSSDTSSSV